MQTNEFSKYSYLIRRCFDRLRESEERQSKIDKSVFVGLQFLVALNNLLVKLNKKAKIFFKAHYCHRRGKDEPFPYRHQYVV